jgi:hypothetical protein
MLTFRAQRYVTISSCTDINIGMPPVFGNEMVDSDLGTLNISFRHLAWKWLGAVHTYALKMKE